MAHSPPDSRSLSRPSSESSAIIKAGLLVGVFYIVYVGLTWRFVGIWWGDYGLWLHEVDRVAAGQVPYRDFSWEYPPLALYVFAAAVRLFGSSVSVPLTLAALVCLAIFASVVVVIRASVDRTLLGLVALATLLTSVAYSSIASETLASGMYTPAAPLGGLLLLLAVIAYMRVAERPGTLAVAAVGGLSALGMLTKPDFWLPLACVLGFTAYHIVRTGAGRWRIALLLLVFLGILLSGIWLIVRAAGWSNFTAGLGGYSVANEELGRMLPSWERIVAQLILLAGVSLAAAGCLRLARTPSSWSLTKAIWWLSAATAALVVLYVACTIRHVWPGLQSGELELGDPTARYFGGAGLAWPDLIGRSFGQMARRLRIYGWPLFLTPAIFVWLVLRWRSITDPHLRQWLLFLVSVSMAGRARRLFEHVDWYHVLFEVPALLLFIRLAFQRQPRAALTGSRYLSYVVMLVGAFSFFDWTLVPVLNLTSFGRPPWRAAVKVETAHGWIRMPEQDAQAYAEVERLIATIDPSGRAPVFAIGNQGPWPYYTGRPNPTPLTYGFSWSNQRPEQVVEGLINEQPHAIVIGESTYERPIYAFPRPTLTLNRWELAYQEYYHSRLDGPYYSRLLSHYEPVGSADGRLRSWTVYRWKDD